MYQNVQEVLENSIAARHGIVPGDKLISINGEEVEDYIDYAYFMAEDRISLFVQKKDGKEMKLFIRKEEGEDIGIVFAEAQIGPVIRCRNKCMFCFVDQLPAGMRDTLYVKDDDWRLSFLMGNYVTLSNLSEKEMARILKRKVSPLYVSVHATDTAVRRKLLGNPKAEPILPILAELTKNGISIHTQIVVCAGINDGDVLTQSINALFLLYPGVQSVAVVPVGLTNKRDGLFPLQCISKENATDMIERIHKLQKQFLQKSGTRFVFAADELYIRADKQLPSFEEYEDFVQIENGVGLIRQFWDEVQMGTEDYTALKYKEFSVATGADIYLYMKEIANELNSIYNSKINVYGIQNNYFGENITVTGLLTGQDIICQLAGKPLGERLFLSSGIFREFENVTLDDYTLQQISKELGVPAEAAPCDGYEWIRLMAKEEL